MEISTFLNWQNLLITVSLIAALIFLFSGTFRQLLDGLKELNSVQEDLMKVKDEKIKALEQAIIDLNTELSNLKGENDKLIDTDFRLRGRLQAFQDKEK